MALFQKKFGPVFLKEESDAANFITKMGELENKTSDPKLKSEIQKQIKLASYGEIGERNISFELKNSGMDMYVLHDIYLEFGDSSAQIDYLVITRKKIYIIECKNLIGNIEIDNQGNFIRTYELFGRKVKEGVYSPITQNSRHLEVIKNVRKSSKGSRIAKAAFEHNFNKAYISLVVLANPKMYFNARYAKKDVRDRVIRADQIINKIREVNSASNDSEYSQKEMMELAKFFLKANKSERSDYTGAYRKMVEQVEKQERVSTQTYVTKKDTLSSDAGNTETDESVKICPKCGNKLILRTAKKGNNAGNQFYGCSMFPKCRYIENID